MNNYAITDDKTGCESLFPILYKEISKLKLYEFVIVLYEFVLL